uniref:Uncharacterized protein n=1 Tax=Human betaherpesvirus 6 TaxID=10368 RepID=A0A5P9TA32_9BETA|nr:hypothetical protein [Human betaherpesvirus 6]QFV25289.1 hypothetical protein [Human betaherpesvirus 6]QFV25727.1 hypothetical protein [Human betaherpesvirus 6]QFV29409.1 hypothetical protein [Human betaherpesvirus 6]QFV33897.1 hypothetical protein [Human betaherpesvirus 6]
MKKKNIFNLLTFYTMKVSKPHFLNVTLLVFFFRDNVPLFYLFSTKHLKV